MYALVDGNNFYVSCERVFKPSLRDRPVIVLSNNDGCAISRSNEAKSLGVQMGQPWFACRDLEKTDGLIALSSNYALYGDMSHRMMTIAAEFAPRQEIYSIDESFLDFTSVLGDRAEIGHAMRSKVLQWIGIPTCAGFGPTKTLAKLANHVAKTAERKPGSYPADYAQVCDLGGLPAAKRDELFQAIDIEEVWGIGRRISAKLKDGGIHTVAEFVRTDLPTLRRRFSVVLERTVLELRGVPTVGLEDVSAARKQILCSRSFGRAVLAFDELREAVSAFASRVAEKARSDASLAGALQVFVMTSPFRKEDKQYSSSVTIPLVRPTADTRVIAAAVLVGLRRVYRFGYRYAKAGVMPLELQPDTTRQGGLNFGDDDAHPEFAASRDRSKLMSAMDRSMRATDGRPFSSRRTRSRQRAVADR